MGLVFGTTRLLLACWERAALHWPTKPIAALVALLAGGAYMLMAGAHVPVMRSFAMACLVTLGVVVGRRALSLRGLALAALALMAFAPQEVVGVSFQMSFAAVLALISGYEALRPVLARLHGDGWWRRSAAHIAALVLTSLLAGTASAPYGAYHFGHIQLYFIAANVLAVPLTATVGHAVRPARPRADAVRAGDAGAHADGVGRAGDPMDRPHRLVLAGGDARGPAHAGLGIGRLQPGPGLARPLAHPVAAARIGADARRTAVAARRARRRTCWSRTTRG